MAVLQKMFIGVLAIQNLYSKLLSFLSEVRKFRKIEVHIDSHDNNINFIL